MEDLQSISMLDISFKHFKRVLERLSHGTYVHLTPLKNQNPINYSPKETLISFSKLVFSLTQREKASVLVLVMVMVGGSSLSRWR